MLSDYVTRILRRKEQNDENEFIQNVRMQEDKNVISFPSDVDNQRPWSEASIG